MILVGLEQKFRPFFIFPSRTSKLRAVSHGDGCQTCRNAVNGTQ